MATKKLNTRIQNKIDSEANWNNNPDFIPLKGEMIVYSKDANNKAARVKFGDGVTKLKDLKFAGGSNGPLTPITKPTVRGSLTYNKSSQTPTWVNYDSSKMTLSGTASATNAGTYTATFTPLTGYCWEDDESTSAINVTWTINKAVGEVILSKDVATLTYNNTAGNGIGDYIEAYTSDDWSIGVGSCDHNDIFVEPHHIASPIWGININSMVLPATGSYTATVTLSGSQNYEDKTITFKVICIQDLDSCSWEMISEVSNSGLASNIFSIGDRKKIVLNGTVGTLTLNNYETYVYIIGFDHNNGTAGTDYGIHFGTFKNANGDDLCLVDRKYADSSPSGTKYFNMNHWGNYNHGGWAGCDMRYDILGSTDKAPSGYGASPASGRAGYDPSATCATTPVANTLMAALPADLRAVMKPMTKYTNNTGASGDTEAKVTVTTDYLPLLAEFEIFGARAFANSYEQNKQKQYDYFVAGNSKTKYRHSDIGSTANWWERSARYDDSGAFCYDYGGAAHSNNAWYANGVAPAFKV